MLKSIIAAAFLITTLTIVNRGAASMTGEQAFAKKVDKTKKKKKKKKFEKIKNDTGQDLSYICSNASDGVETISPNGKQERCCSKSKNFCVICPTKGKGDCKKRSYLKFPPTNINKPGLGTRPSGTVLAPAAGKPKPAIPPVMGTIIMTPATNAPTVDKPKTRPAIIMNRILRQQRLQRLQRQ